MFRSKGRPDYELARRLILLAEPNAHQRHSSNRLSVEDALVIAIHAMVIGTGKRPTDIQVDTARRLILFPSIADVPTGEGKTYISFLAACSMALLGRTVHVLTANDYLAHRDAEELREAYVAAGVPCGCIIESTPLAQRIGRHQASVLYSTIYQVGFDLLRDRIASPGAEVRGPVMDAALFDEADAALLDEAVTPLVLSTESDSEPLHLPEARGFAKQLIVEKFNADSWATAESLLPEADVLMAAAGGDCFFTEKGFKKVEKLLVEGGITSTANGVYWPGEDAWLDQILKTVIAEKGLLKDVDYVVRDGKIVIIQPHTGRPCERRRWGGGLQQAVERKENCAPTPESWSVAETSMQALARRYRSVSGLSGSALPANNDFLSAYRVGVFVVPPYTPCRRVDFAPEVYGGRQGQRDRLVALVSEAHGSHRPCLVITETSAQCLFAGAAIEAAGIAVVRLHAENDHEEASVVANAGRARAVTVSTRMAGRGTDIQLTREATNAGGLRVIILGLPRNARDHKQALGRGGRRGDPGDSFTLLSLHDSEFLAWSDEDQVRALREIGVEEHDRLNDPRVLRLFEMAWARHADQESDAREALWVFGEIEDIQARAFEAIKSAMGGSHDARRLSDEALTESWLKHCHRIRMLKDSVIWAPYGGETTETVFRRRAYNLFCRWIENIGNSAEQVRPI